MRGIRRGVKFASVVAIVLSMAINPAMACRLSRMLYTHASCCPPPCCPSVCYPVVEYPCYPSYPCDPCYPSYPTDVVGGDGHVIEDGHAVEEIPVESAQIESDVAAEPSPVDSVPSDDALESAPPMAEPDTSPMPEPGAEDDLFAEPSEDDMLPPDDEPAADDDLDLFNGDDATPSDVPPAPDQPADDLDLFGGPEPDAAAPAAAEEPLDVFPGADDATPEAEPSDLPPTEGEAPADDDDLDDLFSVVPNGERIGSRRGTSHNAGQPTAKRGMRVWTDNTGRYQTVGRLVIISKTYVRLLKENGKHATVPLTRLSDDDLSYVNAVAHKLASGATSRLISR